MADDSCGSFDRPAAADDVASTRGTEEPGDSASEAAATDPARPAPSDSGRRRWSAGILVLLGSISLLYFARTWDPLAAATELHDCSQNARYLRLLILEFMQEEPQGVFPELPLHQWYPQLRQAYGDRLPIHLKAPDNIHCPNCDAPYVYVAADLTVATVQAEHALVFFCPSHGHQRHGHLHAMQGTERLCVSGHEKLRDILELAQRRAKAGNVPYSDNARLRISEALEALTDR